jgi:hypothetical protein
MIEANVGKSLEKWCNISTCMIEKNIGNPQIDKLRVIHIYEADYNLILKIMWARKSVWNAEDKGQVMKARLVADPVIEPLT